MAKNPLNWEDYDHGRSSPRQGSVGSLNSRVHFEDGANETDRLMPPRDDSEQDLRRRRSSISMRMQSITQAGGLNSIENFARSWQRAVGFHEIAPSRNSFLYTEEPIATGRQYHDEERTPAQHRSLLRQQIEQEGTPPEAAVLEEGLQRTTSSASGTGNTGHVITGSPNKDIFSHATHLTSAFSSSFSGTYGSMSERVNEASREHAAKLFIEQQKTGEQNPDKEREPMLLKRTEDEDGKVVIEVVGQSTIYQTILNSTNVLIGIGLLSLPLGIRYAGWVVGLIFLTLSALCTGYTARLLGKCMTLDRNLITFADLAYVSFGPKAQVAIGIMFSLELTAAAVALFVLFADSLNLLVHQWGVMEFKIICALILLPLSFVPLRYLGYTSSLGIICCITIVILVIVDGFIKQHAPGSLLKPATTHLFPQNWSTLPLSFGLLMSPWGGHAVFPNIMKDMRHPEKYSKSLLYTFSFTYVLDSSVAIVGLLMFGDTVRDEVTSNILTTDGYPKALSYLMVICIAIIPLTKLPLNVRPIYSTIDHICGLGPQQVPDAPGLAGMSGLGRGALKIAIRVVVTLLIMIIAMVCPSFDRVMALMGSAFCFTICIILPCAFYLKLFGKDIGTGERILAWSLIGICSILAIIGTVWAFLPKELTHAR